MLEHRENEKANEGQSKLGAKGTQRCPCCRTQEHNVVRSAADELRAFCVQVAVDGALQLFEHLEEGQVPGVVFYALVGWRERLVPLIDSSSVDDGDLKLVEDLAADSAQVVGVAMNHRVVEIQVLVAGDARDVDAPANVVFERITLHVHRTLVLEVVIIVQFLEQGDAVLTSRGIVVTTAVLSQ